MVLTHFWSRWLTAALIVVITGVLTIVAAAGDAHAGWSSHNYGQGCVIYGGSYHDPNPQSYTYWTAPWCTETYNSHSYVLWGNNYSSTPGWKSYEQLYSWVQGVSVVVSTHNGALPFYGRGATYFGTSDY
jgi:hypothetical protein